MRKFLIGAIIAVAAIGLGIVAWKAFGPKAPTMELDPPVYSDWTGWATHPSEPPAAVWQEGWDVDVFLIGPDQSLSARSPAQLARKVTDAETQATAFADALAGTANVYAPLYRVAGADDDVARAFDAYLASHNNGRALLIATDRAVPERMMTVIRNDEMLKQRFGGFLILPGTSEFDASAVEGACSERFPDGCAEPLDLDQSNGVYVPTEEAVGTNRLLNGYVDWLAANVAPLAEPLGALEEIEVNEIRKPGDEVVDPDAE